MVDVTVATSYIHMLLIIYTAYDQQHKKHLISDKITNPSGHAYWTLWICPLRHVARSNCCLLL